MTRSGFHEWDILVVWIRSVLVVETALLNGNNGDLVAR